MAIKINTMVSYLSYKSLFYKYSVFLLPFGEQTTFWCIPKGTLFGSWLYSLKIDKSIQSFEAVLGNPITLLLTSYCKNSLLILNVMSG